MKSMRVVIIVAGTAAVAAGLAAVRHLRLAQKEHAPLVLQVPTAVLTAPVTEGLVVSSQHVLGTVVGDEESDLAPQVMARIVSISVREGDRVRAGQVVAQLDTREFSDAVAEAEAALAAANVAYQTQRDATARDRRLFEAKAISREQWDRSRSAEAAVAAQDRASALRLDQARSRLSYCSLTAPVAGLIARRLADPGDLAVPGKPVIKLVRDQAVRVRGALSAESFSALHVGQPVTLRTDSQAVPTVVARVYPSLGSSHLTSFECDLAQPPQGVVSGATVGMDVQMKSAVGLVVPSNALLEGDTGSWVFAVDDEKIRPVAVQVRVRSADRVAVTGALRVGEAVVVAEPSRLMTLGAGTRVVATVTP